MKHFYLKIIFGYLLFCLYSIDSFATPPPNDACANASAIAVSSSGYGIGTFLSTASDLTDATVQAGESFAPAIFVAGQTQKSVWYKFTLGTTRKVRVSLMQSGTAITAGDVGFTVYKTSACLPTNAALSTKLTPIITFGNSFHPCVEPGQYLVQVSSNAAANGSIKVELKLEDAEAIYDHPADAYQFGTLSGFTKVVDYEVLCQSLENNTEVCAGLGTAQQYNKSTWHTFTTPNYFDFIGLLFSGDSTWASGGTKTAGIKIYKGNCVTNYAGLNLIYSCDSFVSNGNNVALKRFKCGELFDENTTYTVQLFFDDDFNNETVRFALSYGGTQPTSAPEPILAQVPASNILGVLPANNTWTSVSDRFACNSQHSLHPCGEALPAAGLLSSGYSYNLSTFYTFKINSLSNVSFQSTVGCGATMISVYSGNLNANCTTPGNATLLLRSTSNNNELTCLAPGTYTIQMSGRDSSTFNANLNFNSLYNGAQMCLFGGLGWGVNLQLKVESVQDINQFSLINNTAFNDINNGNALNWNVDYQMAADSFGCDYTVLPDTFGTYCTVDDTIRRVIYREFTVSDSSVAYFSGIVPDPFNATFYQLYAGSASALASTQGVNDFPETITGLSVYAPCTDIISCNKNRVCLEPGTYTYATIGNGSDEIVGWADAPVVRVSNVSTLHYDSATVQNMGSIIDSIGGGIGTWTTDVDYFSCKDNAVTIDGNIPCAKKAIYRQFYLSQPSMLSITRAALPCQGAWGKFSIFSGQMSAVGTAGLSTVATCQTSYQTPQCVLLPQGWYTLVDYGTGPRYGNNFINNNNIQGKDVGLISQLLIEVKEDCEAPQFNRPYKAATNNGNPFLIKWNAAADTGAYPLTRATYTLPTEHFNCTVDTPFSNHPVVACQPAQNRVAYYVFKLTQESFLQINNPGQRSSKLYAFDVRTDSAQMLTATPVQPCIESAYHLEVCKAQPGTYTLVVFAGDIDRCDSLTPSIYIDKVGTSRFDFAHNAYDFGTVPNDSIYHNGAVGDVNPLNANRAPSNDFFYCTTGAFSTDPSDAACGVDYNPNIYVAGVNNNLYETGSPLNWSESNASRRNLWYTFVVDQPGWVSVKVQNKTAGGTIENFAVYKSDVNGNLPFNTIVNNGSLDSALAQGLQLVATNLSNTSSCSSSEELTFFKASCGAAAAQRYFIIVDNKGSESGSTPQIMIPNRQVEVSVLLDTVTTVAAIYDHYSTAYDFGTVGVGTYFGGEANYSCATADATDPLYAVDSCAERTLWYKFTVPDGITGHVRYRMRVDSTSWFYGYQNLQLFSEAVPGDSTDNGLIPFTYPGTYLGYGSYWSSSCVSPGTYYLMLTGCGRTNEDVFPQILIEEEAGDFCAAPVVASITGTSSTSASITIDCHTIGTDYGEYSPTLTCPNGAITEEYKSSWFRIDVTGTDTLDITTSLSNNTNTASSLIKYRMMTGDCAAMQEQSCVQDALTQNTYKCLAPGKSYYLQVFTPVNYNPNTEFPTIGDVVLNINAVEHEDTCAPITECIANANFLYEFDCDQDDSVQFSNYSSYGSSIHYLWNFGYGGATSTEVSPQFMYPSLSTNTTYTVTLTVTNTDCGESNTVTQNITIPAAPELELGNDTIICNPTAANTFSLNAATFAGTTYLWSDGSQGAIFNNFNTGNNQAYVTVTYNGCTKSDTIDVYISPLTPTVHHDTLCTATSISLNAAYNASTTYLWNNGSTASTISVSSAGTYWVKKTLNSCTVTDTFHVVQPSLVPPLGNDTSFCLPGSLLLNATVAGATSYQWQNGSTNPQYTVTLGGTYSVTIHAGSCFISDTIVVVANSPVDTTVNASICAGGSYLGYTTAGTHIDTFVNVAGCDSIRTLILTISPNISQTITLNKCIEDLPFVWNGNTISSGGNGVSTYTTPSLSAGCDSTTTLNVAIIPKPTVTVTLVKCANQMPFVWNGISVSTGGAAVATYTTSSLVTGCDSLTKLNVTVNPNPIITVTLTICANELPFTWNGNTISSGGNAVATYVSASIATGCDSTTKLNVIVNPVVATNLYDTVCTNDLPYTFNGQSINASGIYSDTLQSAVGCDSILSLHLNVLPIDSDTIDAEICTGGSYLGYTAAGTYIDSFLNTAGCDSIRTIVLTVNPNINVTVTLSKCITDMPFVWNGTTISAGGNGVATYTATSQITGCDSTTTLNVVVIPNQNVTVTLTKCANELPFVWNGNNITAGGNAVASYTTTSLQTGCDSITKLNVVVNPNPTAIVTLTKCANELPFTWNGVNVNVGGNAVATYISASAITGCDSTTTLNVIVNPVLNTDLYDTLCVTELPYSFNGQSINAGGIYYDTLQSVAGCDSLLSLHLNVLPISFDTINAAICQGENYLGYTTAGVHVDTFVNSVGCDSIRTIILIVNPPINQTLILTKCVENLPFVWHGNTISSGGNGLATYSTPSLITGCDSTTTLNVIVIQNPIVTETITKCVNELPFIWNGNNITFSGNGVSTFTTASLVNGCDSITTLNVLVNPNPTAVETLTKCANELPFVWNGINITTGGNAVATYVSAAVLTGCDSTTTLNVIVNPVLNTDLYDTVCASELPYLFNGQSINASGIYFDTLQSVAGCDSMLTFQLNVLPLSFDTSFVEICEGETYSYGGNAYDSSGNYTFTFGAANGCDSFFTLALTVHPMPPAPTVISPVIYCQYETASPLTASGSNLLWYSTSSGGTGSSAAPTPNTSVVGSFVFYVSQTTNNCEGPLDSIVVEIRQKPDAAFIITPLEACELDPFTATFTGSMPPQSTMHWNWDGASVSGADPGPYTLLWDSAGNKIVTLWIDNQGCTSDTAIRAVIVNPIPEPPQITMDDYVCVFDMTTISGSSDAESPSYFWNVDGEQINGATVINKSWNTSGEKIVSLYVSSNGCPSKVTYDTIDVIPLPDASISASESIDVCRNDTIALHAVDVEGSQYIWTPEVFFRETTNVGADVIARMVDDGVIRLDVTDKYGCTNFDSLAITTVHCCTILVPNAFSPNNDGLNDAFGLISEAAEEINVFAIYNRWGERVFVSYKVSEKWDGTYKGLPADGGVYHYYLKYTCSNGEVFVKKGDLTLLR